MNRPRHLRPLHLPPHHHHRRISDKAETCWRGSHLRAASPGMDFVVDSTSGSSNDWCLHGSGSFRPGSFKSKRLCPISDDGGLGHAPDVEKEEYIPPSMTPNVPHVDLVIYSEKDIPPPLTPNMPHDALITDLDKYNPPSPASNVPHNDLITQLGKDIPPPPTPIVAHNDLITQLECLILGQPLSGGNRFRSEHQLSSPRTSSSLSSNASSQTEFSPIPCPQKGTPDYQKTCLPLRSSSDSQRSMEREFSSDDHMTPHKDSAGASPMSSLTVSSLCDSAGSPSVCHHHDDLKQDMTCSGRVFHSCDASEVPGVIIVGGSGCGKTAIIEQLVNGSTLHLASGDRGEDGNLCKGGPSMTSVEGHGAVQSGTSPGGMVGVGVDPSSTGGTSPSLMRLAGQVVAWHFCQTSDSATCMVPEFVHSLASYLAIAPQLGSYRCLMAEEPSLRLAVSMKKCSEDPCRALLHGILEPLRSLRSRGQISAARCLIVVDALDEAEFYKAAYSDTVASFVSRHAGSFPSWLKMVVTCRTLTLDAVRSLPYRCIVLDRADIRRSCQEPLFSVEAALVSDMIGYIDRRVSSSCSLRDNICSSAKCHLAELQRFAARLQSMSEDSFLYTKLVLDLIEAGQLVLKSSNYGAIPVSMSEAFLLHFNIRFPSAMSFERVSDILNISLASLRHPTSEELFVAVNSGIVGGHHVTWDDFCRRLFLLDGFLVRGRSKTFTFVHPAFREWLTLRGAGESCKFLCDPRRGHALMAFRLSRTRADLPADEVLELGHHLLKAHIYKTLGRPNGYSSRDMQALWMCLSSSHLSQALVVPRNVFSPNVKVSQLILSAGGDAGVHTEFLHGAALLSVYSREGCSAMVTLLLHFGADVNMTSGSGIPPVSHAASGGHVDVIRLLHEAGCSLSLPDGQGQGPAVHAVIGDRPETLSFLLQLMRQSADPLPAPGLVAQQCLSFASAYGHLQTCGAIGLAIKLTTDINSWIEKTSRLEIVEFLRNVAMDTTLDTTDSLLGETALSAACSHGRREVARYLIQEGADVATRNCESYTPLMCAATAGWLELADMLLSAGSDPEEVDKYGRSSLVLAAVGGHLSTVDLLLRRGATLERADKDGLTALGWSCREGQIRSVRKLIRCGACVNSGDVLGRTPLHHSAHRGDVTAVQWLVECGADVERSDRTGLRPLHHAVSRRNASVIVCLLERGAGICSEMWGLAAGKVDALLPLLNRTTLEGNILYKLYAGAVDLASRAITTMPANFEGYYARARARRDDGQYGSALNDMLQSLSLAPDIREVKRLLARLTDECSRKAGLVPSGHRAAREGEASVVAGDSVGNR